MTDLVRFAMHVSSGSTEFDFFFFFFHRSFVVLSLAWPLVDKGSDNAIAYKFHLLAWARLFVSFSERYPFSLVFVALKTSFRVAGLVEPSGDNVCRLRVSFRPCYGSTLPQPRSSPFPNETCSRGRS